MNAALIGIGIVMMVATALPWLRRDEWWIRIFDFPRLQVAVITIIVLVAYLYLNGDLNVQQRVFVALLFVCVGYQSYCMLPYTPLLRAQTQRSRNPRPGATLAFVFANVLQTNRDSKRLLASIRKMDPDIILLAETDEWWQSQLRELEADYPHLVHQPQDNTYGMLLYSRLPLRNAEVKFLVEDDVPSIHACVQLRSGQEIELRCLHPRPPAPQENDRSTERDAELLIVGKEIKKQNAPAVVLGDLNDVAWSHTNDLFKNVSGLLDPRIGRGFYHTFNAKWPLIRFPLDHCFHSRHFRLVDFRCLPACGSDHFPVYISLSYEPEAEHEQKHLRPSPEERAEAEEKIQRVS